MNKRVVAYCRVSTKSEDQENSYENQKSYFQREIRNNKDYNFCGIYADRGITGTTLEKRPDFNRMLTDAGLDIDNGYKIIAEPKFDLIVTKNTSRFARNVSVDVILKALAKNKVYVHFLDLNKTTENTEDITYIQIFNTFDERESRDKSVKTTFGMIEGANKGVILCNNKIHGYDYIQKENRLKANKHAPDIKRMFEMYAEGIGAYRIANIFFDEGVRDRDGKPYKEYTIRSILENEKYYGMVTRMKYDTGKVFNKHSYARIRPEDEQIRFMSERVEPIISKELFEKAQTIKTSRQQHITQIGKNKGVNKGTTQYAEKIKCGSCGTQYRAFQTKQYGDRKERYFCCVGKQNIDKSKRCKNPNISETFLNRELKSEKYTAMLAASFLVAERFVMKLVSDLESVLTDKNVDKELARLEVEQEEYQAKIDKGVELYLDGTIDKETVEKQLTPIRQKHEKVTAKIDGLTKPREEIEQDMLRIHDSADELMRRMHEMYDIDEMIMDEIDSIYFGYNESPNKQLHEAFIEPKKQFTQSEILKDISRIVVQNDKRLIIEFKTFDEIEQLVNTHRHLMSDTNLEVFNELKEKRWNVKTEW